MLPLVLSILACSTVVAPPQHLPELRVSGNKVVARNGKQIVLRGVNCAGMEWSANGEGHIEQTIRTAAEWKCNIVRLPLCQDRWFGKADGRTDGGMDYRALVDRCVNLAGSLGLYIILDLHWNDGNEWGKHIGQHKMPDQNSIAFWKSCAGIYKNRSNVLFDLYNEPHDVSREIWLNGGDVAERSDNGEPLSYQAVGMQQLLDTVRATGANNVVVAGGLDWAYDMTGFLAGITLKDARGRGVIYANHAYPFKGDSVEKWIGKMEAAIATLPVIVSEFGSDPNNKNGVNGAEWVTAVVKALHDHGWSYTAWDLHPGASPCLISGWDYTPTAHFGVMVKADLATQPASAK